MSGAVVVTALQVVVTPWDGQILFCVRVPRRSCASPAAAHSRQPRRAVRAVAHRINSLFLSLLDAVLHGTAGAGGDPAAVLASALTRRCVCVRACTCVCVAVFGVPLDRCSTFHFSEAMHHQADSLVPGDNRCLCCIDVRFPLAVDSRVPVTRPIVLSTDVLSFLASTGCLRTLHLMQGLWRPSGPYPLSVYSCSSAARTFLPPISIPSFVRCGGLRRPYFLATTRCPTAAHRFDASLLPAQE